MAGVNQERRGPMVLLLMLAIDLLLVGYLISLWGWGMVIDLAFGLVFVAALTLSLLYWKKLDFLRPK